MSNTQFPASLIVYTPAGAVYRCNRHARDLVLDLLDARGCFAFCGPAQDGMVCSICVDESNGQPRPHNGGTREVLTQGEVK